MRTIYIVLLSIFTIMDTWSQNKTIDRQPYAAGRFYPANREELMTQLSDLFGKCKKSATDGQVRAIISPHAGYMFSGGIAASAFSTIPKSAVYNNIFIIGSSHVMAIGGASVYNTGDYITPLGKIAVNIEIANKLKKENKAFNFPTEAHAQEHSIEVQIPFIQYYFKKIPPIVPIIIGTDNPAILRQIADALRPYFTSDNLFVISSDFSHYPPYKDAVENDRATAESIESGNPQTFLGTLETNSEHQVKGLVTSMCGWTSGLVLMYLSENNKKLNYKLIDYCNSGDSPYGGKDEVVGYNAIVLTESKQQTSSASEAKEEFSFTNEEKALLFKIARSSILSKFHTDDSGNNGVKMPPKFMKPMGAFVTLKINGALRGCIGRFISSEPLYEVVRQSALSSAFDDPRFAPLTMAEYKNTDIEITVLGPLKKISNINEIILGKHGIYIKKDSRSGTMLPQVATENNWTVEEFLGYTSRDKAGLGWDGWKNADLYIYEGVVLEENKK